LIKNLFVDNVEVILNIILLNPMNLIENQTIICCFFEKEKNLLRINIIGKCKDFISICSIDGNTDGFTGICGSDDEIIFNVEWVE